MSKARSGSRARDKGPKRGPGDWKQFVSAGALVAAVATTLILAALLRAGPDPRPLAAEPTPREAPSRTFRAETVPQQPAAPAPRIDPSPEEEAPPPERVAGDPLPLRAARDRDRLASRGADWTLQFARLCEREHAERILAALESREDLYLVERDGCYLVCWGLYGSADLARTAGGVPSVLAELPDRPFPKRVQETLR